jgi:hypothetical protein
VTSSAIDHFVPSEADIEVYEEHGWFAPPEILPEHLLRDVN